MSIQNIIKGLTQKRKFLINNNFTSTRLLRTHRKHHHFPFFYKSKKQLTIPKKSKTISTLNNQLLSLAQTKNNRMVKYLLCFCAIVFMSFGQHNDFSTVTVSSNKSTFDQEKTEAEIKANLIALIDAYAMAEKSGRKFKASFEGDFLRMIVLSSKDGKELNKGLLFDFKTVYKFDPLSLRKNDRAYINIWTNRVRWEDRQGNDRMDKIKLIIRVNSHEKARELLDTFKQLHAVLIKK